MLMQVLGPNLVLYRNSSSPAVDDNLGKVAFQGENDADQVVEYFSIRTYISDETDGTEDGHMQIVGVTNGADKKRLDLKLLLKQYLMNDSLT